MTATYLTRSRRLRGGSRFLGLNGGSRDVLSRELQTKPQPTPQPDAPVVYRPDKNPRPVVTAGVGAFTVMFFAIFRTGKFLASGDVAPLIVDGLRHELGWQWTHQTTGAGGPTYEIARTIEVAAVQLSRMLGGSEAMGQRLLYSLLWGFAAAAGASLAIRFTNRPKLATALGLAAVFNPYTLIAQPNPLPIVALAVACGVTALACDAARGRSRRWAMLALLTIPCSYLSLNPPLLVLVAAIAIAQLFVTPFIAGGGLAGAKRVVGLFLRSAPLAAVLSLWWAVPAFIAIRKADPTAVGAVTDIDAWAWTHRRSSIANVLTLFGHWSWPRPEYYARATVIESLPWSLFRWVIPIGAILAPILVRRPQRARAVFATALIGAAVIVGKGVHEPLSGVNRWLYANIPGFWLFREPAAKVGVVLVVLYTIAFAMAADEVLSRFEARTRSSSRQHAIRGVAAMLVVAPLAGVWPLWTGYIIKSGSATQPGDRSALPPEWRDVAKTINNSGSHGKTLVLPIDDYYQVPTTWGYYGADNLVRRLLRRPVLQSDPQLYVGDSDVFETLMKTVEKSIVLNDGQGTASLLRALGVSHIVVRRDIDFASTKRALRMQQPEAIFAGLRQVDGLRLVKSTSVADVFELTDRPGRAVEAMGGIVEAGDLPPVGLSLLRSALPDGLVLASKASMPKLAAGRAIVQQGTSRTGSTDFGSIGSWIVSRHADASPAYTVSVGPDSMRAQEIIKWEIAGKSPLPRNSLDMLLPGLAAVEIGEQYLDRWTPPAIIRIDAATTAVPWLTTSTEPGLGQRTGVLDCNNHDRATPEEIQLSAKDVSDRLGDRLELRARRHSACVRYAIRNVTSGQKFQVRIQARSLQGSDPRMCIWLHGLNRCAPIAPFEYGANGDVSISTIWEVPSAVTGADLYLYADESQTGEMTVIQYEPPVVNAISRGIPIPLRPAPNAPVEVQLSAGVNRIGATFLAAKATVGSIGPLGDCNRSNENGPERTRLRRTLIPEGVRLEAREHAACVRVPFEDLTPLLPYEISFEHRTVRGNRARYCVLAKGNSSCIASGRLESSGNAWTTERISVDAPIIKAPQALALYVYADGSDVGTRNEYRNITISPFVDEYLALLSADTKPRTAPDMSFERISPARYRVKVPNVTAPFVLALSDSWSSDWRVTGAPSGAKIDHLLIDGYRNGWALDTTGDLDLLLEYVPARAGQLAIRISAIGALLAVGIGIVELRRRRSVRFDVEPIADMDELHTVLASAEYHRDDQKPEMVTSGS